MLTYEEVVAELDSSLTVSEIAAKYQADFRTLRDIELGQLRSLLSNYRLLIDGRLGWTGLLLTSVEAMEDEKMAASLNQAIDLLVAQLRNPTGKVISTTLPKNGLMMVRLCAVTDAMTGFDHDGFKAELEAIFGGYRYGPAVTAEAIQQVIELGERQSALAGLIDNARRYEDAAARAFRRGDSIEDMKTAALEALEA